jgi:hypothetical protein
MSEASHSKDIKMPIEHKLIRVEDPADPQRCQAGGDKGEGQCMFRAVEGVKYCPKHGAGYVKSLEEKKALHDYRLQKWMVRVGEFSASENVTSLRGEVGILRMTLEETLNMCSDQKELMLYSHRIQDIVMKIDKIVNSVAKIEMRSGNLLDKSAALVLAGQIVDLITRHVTDPKVVDDISEELINLIAKLAGKDVEME